MMSRGNGMQQSLFSVTLEEIVPNDHFLRKLDSLVDFSFMYEDLAPYYCDNNGKPSVDPVIIVKSYLIGFLYGIESERRLEQELNFNVAYRWFLGLGFDKPVPDHSTISQLRRRKFNDADIFKKLFVHVVYLCVEKGLVSGKLLVTDSTHVKANASKLSKITVEIENQTTEYFEKLDVLNKYEAEEREHLGLPKINRKTPEPKTTTRTKSKTDTDSGWLNRPDKPEGFHYLSHQTIDAENGIILDVTATPGNIPDNTPYIESIDNAANILSKSNTPIESISADSIYDTAIIHKELKDRQITPFMPKKQMPDNSKVEYKRDDFTYSQENDEFTCPMGETLKFRNIGRHETGIYKQYRAKPKDCKLCESREKCLAKSQTSRVVQVNIFQGIVDEHHREDGTPQHKYALNLRQIWCEGTFATQKARHNLRKLYRRGISAAKDHFYMAATAINLKRMVKCLG